MRTGSISPLCGGCLFGRGGDPACKVSGGGDFGDGTRYFDRVFEDPCRGALSDGCDRRSGVWEPVRGGELLGDNGVSEVPQRSEVQYN